ncbi:MAG: GTP cyclohydrolase I FolE [Nitrosopumilaceae archaeon]|nr:GTP cyclohydrolase I [Nitrosopumilaceae archaeon]NIU87821.1 GTP cyclohydrolase I FolE [Nitrosopumilaceae archaeon]NIV65203.1 GTP cyclohydrolase I FolE [Nitrosopumilaceae archaeon]NIX61719.1 GTP cyclohydrolase I FolE [Nitrosopumilaceae archaeon]
MKNGIEKGVELILESLKHELGLDLSDENFNQTPQRIVRTFKEIFSGISNTEQQVKAILETSFPCGYSEMVVMRDIEVFSMCPHHLLPVHYFISVAYIPSPDGRVLGVSKLVRLVEVLARRPVMQEKLVSDIADALMSIPMCVGSGCIATGNHYCMKMRGVRQNSADVVTSVLRGSIFDDPKARAEFMLLCRR